MREEGNMQITNIAIDKLNPAKYNPRLDLQPDDKEYQDIKKVNNRIYIS